MKMESERIRTNGEDHATGDRTGPSSTCATAGSSRSQRKRAFWAKRRDIITEKKKKGEGYKLDELAATDDNVEPGWLVKTKTGIRVCVMGEG